MNTAISRAWPEIAQRQNLDPVQARRALDWRQVESAGQRFELRFVSDQPRRAWAVLDDALGAVDRSISSIGIFQDSPYESIRGVDGALLPIPAEQYSQPGLFDSTPAIPVSEGLQPAFSATERKTQPFIPFDAPHARPAPGYGHTIRMAVIDSPGMPVTSEVSWLRIVVIGAGAGFALAMLMGFLSGFFVKAGCAQTATPQ